MIKILMSGRDLLTTPPKEVSIHPYSPIHLDHLLEVHVQDHQIYVPGYVQNHEFLEINKFSTF